MAANGVKDQQTGTGCARRNVNASAASRCALTEPLPINIDFKNDAHRSSSNALFRVSSFSLNLETVPVNRSTEQDIRYVKTDAGEDLQQS